MMKSTILQTEQKYIAQKTKTPMSPEQAFDYLCSLAPHNQGFHIQVQYLKLRMPDELVDYARSNKVKPRHFISVKNWVSSNFDKQIKIHIKC